MPLSESTMARAGPASIAAAMSASMARRSASGRVWIRASRSPRPLPASMPSRSNVAAWVANTSPKYARTACPNMIGSDTFIIVALRCTEKSTPCSRASAICAARNSSSALARITVASTISPSRTGSRSTSAVTVPSEATSSTRRSPAAATVTDCSLDRKSSAAMCATCVFESGDHAPIECGWLRA